MYYCPPILVNTNWLINIPPGLFQAANGQPQLRILNLIDHGILKVNPGQDKK